MGYFVLDHLTTLADNGAYFLCRLLTSTNLSTKDGQHVDLLSVLRADTRDRFELALHLGKQVRLPCRVCVFRVPEDVAKRRRRHAKERMRKKGKQVSKRAHELLGWTMLVTNVPVSMLSLNHVALLYAVRWQVELVFKLWKSHMHVHRISGSRKERILVELYAKLIGLVLFHFLLMPLRAKDLDLSPTKAFKMI